MSPAGFKPAVTASERPQTRSLVRAVTGIGLSDICSRHKILVQFGTQFYSATVRQLEMFFRQLFTKVRIWRAKDGLGMRI